MPNLQLSRNLTHLRKASHLTQDQVSEYLNISRQAYSNYETCNRMPDLDTLILLSNLYRVSLDQLVTYNYSNGSIEQLDLCSIGLNIKTTDTIYLTDKEVDLIYSYRTLNEDTRTIIDGFLSSQTNTTSKE